MVIGFHSQGSTNVFFASTTAGSLNVDIAFNGSVNAVAAGFPSSLTSVNQASTLGVRVCFILT
jgi:hypothetical protein